MDTSLNLGGEQPKATKAKATTKPKREPKPRPSESETAKAAKAAIARVSSGYSKQDALTIGNYIAMLESAADG
jgi:hypothetical protein